jgi:hypothetical protein
MTASAEQRLAELTLYARTIGYCVRHDHLDGCGGGLTIANGIRWILLDDMQTPADNVRRLLRILRADTEALGVGTPAYLRDGAQATAARKAA